MKINLSEFENTERSNLLQQRKSTKAGVHGIVEIYYFAATKQSPEKTPIIVIAGIGEHRRHIVVPWSAVVGAVVCTESLPKNQPFGISAEYDTKTGKRRTPRTMKTAKAELKKRIDAKTPNKNPE